MDEPKKAFSEEFEVDAGKVVDEVKKLIVAGQCSPADFAQRK